MWLLDIDSFFPLFFWTPTTSHTVAFLVWEVVGIYLVIYEIESGFMYFCDFV